MMRNGLFQVWIGVTISILVVGLSMKGAFGIRFVIEKEECFSHKVEMGETVHYSFVVIRSEGQWHDSEDGVDFVYLLLLGPDNFELRVSRKQPLYLYEVVVRSAYILPSLDPTRGIPLVKGPSGEQIHDLRDKISEKSEFTSHHEGVYRFCFTNKSPYHETIDFDLHAAHFVYHDEHAKDEHFKPLFEHIGKLEEALYNIQFEQHWLEAQTDRQAIVNEGMSKRAMYKALFESSVLICVSFLQVFLLKNSFERKLGQSRV